MSEFRGINNNLPRRAALKNGILAAAALSSTTNPDPPVSHSGSTPTSVSPKNGAYANTTPPSPASTTGCRSSTKRGG